MPLQLSLEKGSHKTVDAHWLNYASSTEAEQG